MQFHPPRVKSFLFCVPLDWGTKIIAYAHTLMFIYLAVSPTVESFLAGRFQVSLGRYFMEISFTSYGIFSLALLYGSMRANPIHMAPWVFLNLLFITMLTVRLVEQAVMQALGYSFPWSIITRFAIIIFVQSYFVTVVYSHCLKLKERPCFSTPIRESSSP